MKKSPKKSKIKKSRAKQKRKIPDWKEYELFVESVYKTINNIIGGSDIVKWNDMIMPVSGKGKHRQVDVSIRSKVESETILTIVSCKHYKKSVDINVIGELYAVIHDVGAQKGVLVSLKGYSKDAKRFAAERGIELFQFHSGSNLKFKLKLGLPVIVSIITPFLEHRGEVTLNKGQTFGTRFNRDDCAFKHIVERFKKDWSEGKLDFSIGDHIYSIPNELQYITDLKGEKVPFNSLQMKYKVTQEFYHGNVEDFPSSIGKLNCINQSTDIYFAAEDIIGDLKLKTHFTRINDVSMMPSGTRHLEFLVRPSIESFSGIAKFDLLKRL